MNFRPLIQESLQLLRFVGLHPLFDSVWEKFIICLMLTTLIDSCFILVDTYRGIDSTMEVLIVVAITQISTKMMFFSVNKAELKLLINNTNMFWQPSPLHWEQDKENQKVFYCLKLFMRLYLVLLLIICLLYITKPLFFIEFNELPWISSCSRYFSFRICYIYEIFLTILVIPLVLCFDFLFISLNTNIICELKLLKTHFPNLSVNLLAAGTDKEAMDELRNLINHHNLILQCVNIMKRVYRVPLLIIFLANMFGLCFSMIIMTSSFTNNTLKLLCLMMTIYYLIQLFFFCVLGSILADESVEITNEAYKSKWWIKTQPELRKALIMVMRRANTQEVLSAGGLLQVNLQTFVMILKSTFSFFTFIQVIYEN